MIMSRICYLKIHRHVYIIEYAFNVRMHDLIKETEIQLDAVMKLHM